MNDSHIILILFLITAGAVLAYAVVQRMKVGKAKRENHHSAMTKDRPDQRSATGAPGVPPQR